MLDAVVKRKARRTETERAGWQSLQQRTQEFVQNNRQHETDTGSPEVQIALLSDRIDYLTEHFKTHSRITIPAAGCSSSWDSGAGCSTT